MCIAAPRVSARPASSASATPVCAVRALRSPGAVFRGSTHHRTRLISYLGCRVASQTLCTGCGGSGIKPCDAPDPGIALGYDSAGFFFLYVCIALWRCSSHCLKLHTESVRVSAVWHGRKAGRLSALTAPRTPSPPRRRPRAHGQSPSAPRPRRPLI